MTKGIIRRRRRFIGTFEINHKTDIVTYTIRKHEFTMNFDGFETMCEVLGYDLQISKFI